MIEFKEGYIPEQNMSTLTAYINKIALMQHGQRFVAEVVHELVKQSVLVHRIDIENMVTEFINLPDTKEYIKLAIREAIDKTIQEEVSSIFNKER